MESSAPTGSAWRGREGLGANQSRVGHPESNVRAALKGRVRRLVGHHRRDRFAEISPSALDHRRFWDTMHAVTLSELEGILTTWPYG